MRKLKTLDKIFYSLAEIIAWGTFVYVLAKFVLNTAAMHMLHAQQLVQSKMGQELGDSEIFESSANGAANTVEKLVESNTPRDLAITFCLALLWTMYRKYNNYYREESEKDKHKKLFG